MFHVGISICQVDVLSAVDVGHIFHLCTSEDWWRNGRLGLVRIPISSLMRNLTSHHGKMLRLDFHKICFLEVDRPQNLKPKLSFQS